MPTNPYDIAHQLARVIRESDELRQFKVAAASIKGKAGPEKLLADFRTKQMEFQAVKMQGKEPSKSQEEGLQRLYETLSQHAEIRSYLQAEHRLGQLMGDLQKILMEAVDVELPGLPPG